MIDTKIKELAMRLIKEGRTLRDVAKVVGASVRNVSRWRKLYREQGSQAFVRPKQVRKKQIDLEKLQAYIQEKPGSNLREIATHFGMSTSRIAILMRQVGVSRKIKSRQSVDNVTKKDKLKILAE